jgi:hypothetical protein
MKAEVHETAYEPEIRDAGVVAWRRTQILAAGCDPATSEELAEECGIDLHVLVELLERGCSPALAKRILAPLDGESRRC